MTTRARVAPLALIACAVALAVSACWKTKRNPLYCDGHLYTCVLPLVCNTTMLECEPPRDGSMGDMAPDLAMPCTDDTSCTNADKPICDKTTKVCRACTASTDCAAFTTTPVCKTSTGACVECVTATDCTTLDCNTSTNKCEKCNVNNDCTSGACLADQSCAAMGDVVIVNNATGCSATAEPFCQVNDAFTNSPKSTVLVMGSATNYAGISYSAAGTKSVVGPGKTANPQATFSGSANGVLFNPTGVTSTLSVAGVSLFNASSAGVDCTLSGGGSATLVIARSLIQHSVADAVDSTSCALTLDANEITSNSGGGVKVNGGSYAVTNNIIALNGTGAGTVSGFVTDTTATGSFTFNTVAKNVVATGAGGIACSTTSHAISNSIVVGNTATSGTQFSDECVFTNIVAGTDSATGVSTLSPAFISTANFRLDVSTTANKTTNDACCIDKATSGPDHDVDQNQRPMGAGYDIGAFETTP